MTKQLKIIPEKCTGCMQCELACSWVQTGTFQPSRSVIRVNVFDEEASYAPFTCVQFDEAWCIIACPFGTVFTLPGSDKAAKCNLCGGQPACATACPTSAIEWTDRKDTGSWF